MKKLFRYLLFSILLLVFTNVKAADFSTRLAGSTSINQNGTFTVTVEVNNANNLWGFMAPINYDSSKLTFTGATGLNGFGVEVGTNFVADNSVGKNGSVKVATLSFKANSNFKPGESATISLGTAEGSDGDKTLTGSGSSITLTVATPKNSNNNLKSLSIKNQTINFNKNTTKYSLTVEHDVEKINISASAEDEKARVSGTGEKKLDLYFNTFDVIVTAENGSQKVYKVEVIRKDIDGNVRELSKENNLDSLSIKGYDFIFDKDVTEYTILLKDVVKELKITAEPKDKNATVTIDNPKQYVEGNNVIKIKVVAENGKEKEYIINVVSLEKQEVKDNNTIFYVIIIIEAVIIVGLLITVVVLLKKCKTKAGKVKQKK